MPGKVVGSSRESLGLTYSVKSYDTFEKAWAGDYRSGNRYRTINYLCVTTVLFAQYD